jgi:plastocyanin
MKKKLLLTASIVIIANLSIAQISHNINVVGFGFSPSNLTIAPGDTVVFNGLSGHSATEVSEENWSANNATSNGGFWLGIGSGTTENKLVLNSDGVYYYICIPHASMGMKGAITVVDPTVSVNDLSKNDDFSILNLGYGKYSVKYTNSDLLSIISLTGKQMQSIDLSNLQNQLDLSLNYLSSGIYLGVFTNQGENRKVLKFVR